MNEQRINAFAKFSSYLTEDQPKTQSPQLSYILPLSIWEHSFKKDEDNFLAKYLWQSYSGWFDLEDYYLQIKRYENQYGIKSEDMFDQWKEGTLTLQSNDINDWIMKFLHIKDKII